MVGWSISPTQRLVGARESGKLTLSVTRIHNSHASRVNISMTTPEPTVPQLGVCPRCNREIDFDTQIEYEKNGQPAIYAECPNCSEVVNPELPGSNTEQ